MSVRVYLFVAHGFEEVETITPLDYLRRAGIALTLVGVGAEQVVSTRGLRVSCDCSLEALCASPGIADAACAADAVLLPGGLENCHTLAACAAVRDFVMRVHLRGGLVAALCAPPARVLSAWNLLGSRRYTCYPGMEPAVFSAHDDGVGKRTEEEKSRALRKPERARVVRDGNLLTACAAGAAEEFSFAVIEALCGVEVAQSVRAQVVAR